MPDSAWSLMLLCGALLALAVAGAIALRRLRARLDAAMRTIAGLQRQRDLDAQGISGLTLGAVGLDRRVARLEGRERVLAERQETYELQRADEQPYAQAIRLVQQGASAARLVQELELSESEADLIVRLHGSRDIA